MDVIVIGAGPAGVMAAKRAAELGAATTLITRDKFGGMAANDGPIPVRTLAHAARLVRESKHLHHYGVAVSNPHIDYPQLLARVREVVEQVHSDTLVRSDLERLGVTILENAGNVHFVDSHTIEGARGIRLRADKIILCAGGCSRKLPVPGGELTATHSDAWSLTSVPPSMLVIGAGATGAQVASIFNAFGSQVQLFEAGPRILPTEDEDVSSAMADAFRDSGIAVHENFGSIESFERTSSGIRMLYSKNGKKLSSEAALAVVAIGWAADTAGLNLAAAQVDLNSRGYVQVNPQLQTAAHHIFAAGDITGRLMLVPQAMRDGYVAATNAVNGVTVSADSPTNPIGSFTDPEYAQVGLTQRQALATHDVLVAKALFQNTIRPIVDGRTTGFCKLIVDRKSHTILGCHIVGERAVEIVQMAAIAIAGRLRVDELARIPLSFPTYTDILFRAVSLAATELEPSRRTQQDFLGFAA
jgi:dihydrolipoamide dehydrogenase